MLYGDEPRHGATTLAGYDRLRVVVNACTRLRFCTADGTMEFREKRGAAHAPDGYRAVVRASRPAHVRSVTVVCGHWSTLELMLAPNVLMLDSGLPVGRDAYRRSGCPTGACSRCRARHPVQPKPFG